MKGIVFEVLRGKATILKNDGTFIQVPAQESWQAGDLVTVRARRVRFPAIIAIAASVLLVFASLFTLLALSNRQAALISIDINTSIELRVNRFGKVLSAEARGDEGAALLANVDVAGLPYAEAVLRLMEDDALGPYLAKNSLLVFSVQAGSAAWQKEVLATLRTSADAYISSHHGATTTEYFIVDAQIVTAAHQHGVTPGKYMMLLELETLAPDIDIADYAHHGVAHIQAEIDAHHGHGAASSPHGTGQQSASSFSGTSPDETASPSSEAPAQPHPHPQPAPQPGGGHEDDGHDSEHGTGHGGGHG
ncbi:hypothetical protein LJC04_05690 [Ruminococcaceae bacterium OttesenSCG-928-O06]|nr:hypothetical protein [Ruminococcaceae bacterium OttesenSCG-928-O06]